MWNKFDASSNEDETLGNSFFTNGLFKISNENKSDKDPTVISAIQNKSIIIAVDKSLIIIEDEAAMDCKFLCFGAEINCFTFSQCGSYIVCCLSDGNIHGIHVKGFQIFNSTIQKEDIDSIKSFIDIQLVGEEFYILCNNGKIYKIKGIEGEQLLEISNFDETTCFNESLIKSNNVERICNHRFTSSINSFCVVQDIFNDIFIICCDQYITIIEGDQSFRVNFIKHLGSVKKIVNLESYIIGLTENGSLIEICPYTRILRELNSLKGVDTTSIIDDMRVLESNDQYIELLTLSNSYGEEREMKVVDYPSLNVKSELLLPKVSWLVSQPKSSINMYFIEGYKNENKFLQNIELKSITEADPEQRFKKLILRGHFDEAEEYAKNYDLKLAPLHEAQVRKTLLDMSLLKSPEKIEAKFEILMKQMEKIEDKDFLVSLRLSNDIPDRSCLAKFLEYLQQNIDTNKYFDEINEINELLLRLETLRLVDPFDTNLQWRKFLHQKDMQRVAMDYFKNDVLLSCLIWSRHATSIIPNLNFEKFYKWLEGIRSTIEPFQLIQFLKHFLPCFLQIYPHQTTRIVDWCIERARSLQFSPAWPEIGLEFINNIKIIFQEIEFLFVDIRRSYHYNVEKILKVIFILEEMVVLKKNYHLTMSFDDYSRNSPEETAFKLLQRIQINNFQKLVNEFLYPIFMEHGLIPEETIVKYINFLAQNKNLGYWQERAVLAIELLNNEENRLNCALLILKVSPVPWSDAVLPLAKLGTTSNHPLANLISIEHKNQAIKIIKIKYGWPVDYFDLQQDRIKLTQRILKINNQDMVDDIKTLVKSSLDIAYDAYFFLMQRLVETGRLDDFAEFVDSIQNEEKSIGMFQKTINIFIELLQDDDFIEGSDIMNYVEASKVLLQKLKENIDEFDYNYQIDKINTIKYMYQLNKEFNIHVSIKDLYKADKKFLLMKSSIIKVVESVIDRMSIDKLWSQVNLLESIFKESRIKLLFMICQELNNVYITCKVIDWLCQSEENFKNDDIKNAFEFAALMISQQIISLENNDFQLKQVYDPLAFPLAYELMLKCLVEYDLICHTGILELMRWISLIRNFYPRNIIDITQNERIIDSRVFSSKKMNGHAQQNGNKRESLSIFDNFEEQIIVEQPKRIDDTLSSVVECVCSAIKIVTLTMNSDSAPYTLFRMYNIDQNSQAQRIKDEFFSSLENLLKVKLCMEAFVIMQMIISHQQALKAMIIPQHFITTVNKKMLKFILSQKEPEYFNAFIIFRSENNKKDCLEYLKGSLKNNSQRIAFSTFSEMYNKYKKNDDFIVDRESRLKLYYYSEICKSYPTLRTSVNLDHIGISEFLKDLENRQLSVDLLQKLSKDFGWNYQKALMKQVKIVLQQQVLEFEIKTDVFGKDEVVVKTSIEAIKKHCMPYVQEITEFNTFGTELEQYFKEVNYYFYELSLAILDMIENAKELSMHYKLYRNILLLLKHKLTFKRRSIDGEEHEYWIKNYALESSVLPAISSWRLPFKMIIEGIPENIISKDLNVENFEIYFPLIQLHTALFKADDKIDPNDRIEKCALSAAKNSVQDMRNQAEATVGAQWNLKPKNNAFLQTVKRMVAYLENKGKALAILYFIVTNTPNGFDQMEAAHECWKFATMYEDALLRNTKYCDLVEKAKRKYPLLKTQHLLYAFGLAEDRMLQLIENPRLLIHALYHHDSILQCQKKEINKLCQELANLYNLDLMTIQVELIGSWLAFAEVSQSEDCDGNETVYEDFMGGPSNHEETIVSDENVIRAYYILGSWNNATALDFLACEMSTVKAHAENQLQLYECFAKLIDENSTNYMELVNTKKYLLIRVCHILKILGYSIKPEKFESFDKIELLKKIWTAHNNNPKGLEVMVLICLGFEVHIPQIWNGILKQMVSHKMIKHLTILVEILSAKTKFLHLSNLKLAWEYVIQHPLVLATKIQNFEEDQKLTKALILLQKCPISTFLNMTNLADKFIRLERPHMASICIAFAKDSDRETIINMLSNCNKRELSKNIEYLEEFGIAPVITRSVANALSL
ncbi:kinetochore-associated protein 1 [Chironomus tepperi]|uniref:kinetochore-associated protein 1 n=1 Tax=Chironomus tepperi TaxID=113505 RepID=UPI00391FC851